MTDIKRRLTTELLGTALLVSVVVGSGIMGDNLSQGTPAVALLGNTLATGAALVVLITIFGPISGAHFNPIVSAMVAWRQGIPWRECFFYVVAQTTGAVMGTLLAHGMFDMPLISFSTHARTGVGVWLGEIIATGGLLLTIMGCERSNPDRTPYAVALFIVAGYWFTSSTSFANPAVTLARALTDSFAGIRVEDVAGFILAQIVGAVLAVKLGLWIFKKT